MQSISSSLRIISCTRFSCQEPDSNPNFSDFLFSQRLTDLNADLGILHFLRPRFLSYLPLSPRSCMRHSQSRTVE